MLQKIIKGVAANALVFVVSFLGQIALLPILASTWGLETYGMWILISTVPAYLALGDFGFATAAGNDMTAKMEQDDQKGTIEVFQSIFLLTTLVVVCVGLFIVFIFANLPSADASPTSIWAEQNKMTLQLMILYGVLALGGGVAQAGFRCSNQYPFGTTLLGVTMFIEALSTGCVALMGGGLYVASMALLILRSLSIAMQFLCLRRVAPWLTLGFEKASFLQIKRLAPSAFAVALLPLGQAMFLQGTAVAVGIALSPAAVVLFTTVRTLTRTPLQFINLINHALLPEVTKAKARGDKDQQSLFVGGSILLSLLAAAGAFLVLLLAGQDIIKLWSNHKVDVPFSLLAAMCCSMVFNITWYPLSNLLLSINKQDSYTYHFLGAAVGAAALAYLFSLAVGVTGAGLALIVFDLYMFAVIHKKIGLFFLRERSYSATVRFAMQSGSVRKLANAFPLLKRFCR